MKTTTPESELREVLRIIRQAAFAERIQHCVEAACELYGVAWRQVMAQPRGVPPVARARVVAMHAAVTLGVPIAVVAKGFRRTRRSVHKAIEIGQPGREKRDAAVLEGMRAVVERVLNVPGMGREEPGPPPSHA